MEHTHAKSMMFEDTHGGETQSTHQTQSHPSPQAADPTAVSGRPGASRSSQGQLLIHHRPRLDRHRRLHRFQSIVHAVIAVRGGANGPMIHEQIHSITIRAARSEKPGQANPAGMTGARIHRGTTELTKTQCLRSIIDGPHHYNIGAVSAWTRTRTATDKLGNTCFTSTHMRLHISAPTGINMSTIRRSYIM